MGWGGFDGYQSGAVDGLAGGAVGCVYSGID